MAINPKGRLGRLNKRSRNADVQREEKYRFTTGIRAANAAFATPKQVGAIYRMLRKLCVLRPAWGRRLMQQAHRNDPMTKDDAEEWFSLLRPLLDRFREEAQMLNVTGHAARRMLERAEIPNRSLKWARDELTRALMPKINSTLPFDGDGCTRVEVGVYNGVKLFAIVRLEPDNGQTPYICTTVVNVGPPPSKQKELPPPPPLTGTMAAALTAAGATDAAALMPMKLPTLAETFGQQLKRLREAKGDSIKSNVKNTQADKRTLLAFEADECIPDSCVWQQLRRRYRELQAYDELIIEKRKAGAPTKPPKRAKAEAEPEPPELPDFPTALRRWREKEGLSQAGLGDLLGLGASIIQKYERDKRRQPSVESYAQLCELAPELKGLLDPAKLNTNSGGRRSKAQIAADEAKQAPPAPKPEPPKDKHLEEFTRAVPTPAPEPEPAAEEEEHPAVALANALMAVATSPHRSEYHAATAVAVKHSMAAEDFALLLNLQGTDLAKLVKAALANTLSMAQLAQMLKGWSKGE